MELRHLRLLAGLEDPENTTVMAHTRAGAWRWTVRRICSHYSRINAIRTGALSKMVRSSFRLASMRP